MTTTTYHAVRVTYDSARDFDETRARFDELVPLLDPAVTIDLVVRDAVHDRHQIEPSFADGLACDLVLDRLRAGTRVVAPTDVD